MPMFGTAQLAAISTVLLKGPWPKTDVHKAGDLWKNRPTVVYAVRRMG